MIRYAGDFDELTWLIDVEEHQFWLVNAVWEKRYIIREWLRENCQGDVYIWNGMLSPDKSVPNYTHLISPDENTAYFIFMDPKDESAFALRFGGNFIIKSFRNGFLAFKDRKSTQF